MTRHVLALVCLLVASPAAAQVEPDLTPLLTAAEDDCAAERLEACRARAELVLAHAPEGSVVRVRARGLVAITEGTVVTLPLERAVEPLVAAAEQAALSGDREALARYAAALRRLCSEGEAPLTRLAAAEASVSSPAETGATGAALPEPTGAFVPAGYRPASPELTPAGDTMELADADGGDDVDEVAAYGYHRRDDGELVDFYLMSAAAGASFGIYLFAVTDWASEIAPFDQGRVYAVAAPVGAGAFLFLPFALDQIDHGMPAGTPGAIAMGLRFGIGLGALSLGASYGAATGDDVGHILFGTTLASGLAFGAVAYLTHPHPSQVQMIQNTGLWGGAIGGFLALAVGPNVDPGTQIGSGLALLGLGGGIVTGSVLSGLELHMPAGRSWLGSLGMVSGAGAGMLVYLLIGGIGGDFHPTIAGVSGLVGSTAGLATALILTEGHRGDVRFLDDANVTASFSPLDGGGMATLSGTF